MGKRSKQTFLRRQTNGQQGKRLEGKPSPTSTFQASACITCANIPLAKASLMVKFNTGGTGKCTPPIRLLSQIIRQISIRRPWTLLSCTQATSQTRKQERNYQLGESVTLSDLSYSKMANRYSGIGRTRKPTFW